LAGADVLDEESVDGTWQWGRGFGEGGAAADEVHDVVDAVVVLAADGQAAVVDGLVE
jgi:hypothetical protein